LKILAVIPARGGSKRLPNKNILLLGDVPLICWTIELAKKIEAVCEILVSTDSPVIAEISKSAGASVPWLRPENLSSDEASSVDVANHAVQYYQSKKGEVDGVLLLQPTSPFRTLDSMIRGIEIFRESQLNPVVGVVSSKDKPSWNFDLDGNLLSSPKEYSFSHENSKPTFKLTGSFYLISPHDLLKEKNFIIPNRTRALIIDSEVESIDIDTELDFLTAQAALNWVHPSFTRRNPA